MEPVATWIISEVTNRLSTSLGFCSEENTSLALSISFLAIGTKFSRIKNRVNKKQINSTAAVIKKTVRNPQWSARKPPASGPSRAPLTAPVDSVPSAQPLLWRGIWVAIRAFGVRNKNRPAGRAVRAAAETARYSAPFPSASSRWPSRGRNAAA